MSNLTENIIVPKLRFPDYRKNKGWREKLLSQVANYENGKAHEQDISEYGDYIVVNSKFISSDGEVKKYSNTGFCLASNGDTLMVLSDVPNGKAIAKCYFVNRDNYFSVNQRICKLTPKAVNSQLLFYILNRNPYFLAFDDGVKQTNLKNEDVLNFPFYLPETPEEQQKIADCLSSLDDLITAETQKLDALKDHKKGLMQQLFPGEGEMVPKLRFEEFRGSGDWVEEDLESLSDRISDGIHTTPIYAVGSDYYFINGNNLINGRIIYDGNTKQVSKVEYLKHKKDLNENSLLLSINGTIGNIAAYNDEKVILGKSACYININNSKVCKIFVYYYLQTESVSKYFNAALTGSTIKNLSLKTIKSTLIKLPKPIEQLQIANYLSNLDEFIMAQTEKIEAMQNHKKGLMQGLFPNLNIN